MVTSNSATLSVLRHHQLRKLEMTHQDVQCHPHHPNALLLQRRNVVTVKQAKSHLHLNSSGPHLKMRMLLKSRHPPLQLAHTLPPLHMNRLHLTHLHNFQPAISPLAGKSTKKMKPSKSSFKNSPSSSNANLKLLTVTNQNHSIMSMSNDADRIIIGSGASTSGTGLKSKLINMKPTSCSVTAAFGESLQPTKTGLLPPLMLETIIIDQMKATTLLSVSQACAQDLIGVFTTKDCKSSTPKMSYHIFKPCRRMQSRLSPVR